ncbi:MAG TPA: energy transducer TonB [Pseudorhodoplanes sp.]|nr:energy transducer TonB [Pseudorhodoplanes sp.]
MTSGRKRPDLKIASEAKQDRADDLLGAVVPLRARDIPATSLPPEADLSNVVAFARRNRKGGDSDAPPIACTAADRPAPQTYSRERQRQVASLIGGSLLIHGAIFAAFNREPEPHASIGMIVVNTEIVLGAQTNAGKSPTPSESEVASAPSPKTDEPTDTKPEAARKDAADKPVEAPKEQIKEKTEAAAPKTQEALPVETPPEPKRAELAAVPKPVEKPTLTATPELKKPEAKEAKKVREAARHAKEDSENLRDRKAPASTPSNASNSIGRGRSDINTNYPGLVAAHLTRFKQYPPNARSGDRGKPTVTFYLSGSGSVTSVRLARGSGVASIDQEIVAMVRRASPFPMPPSGWRDSFTVSVDFDVR